jgi:CRISPR system Cascade subunit CasE
LAGSPVILVLSAREPDWNYAFQNAPLLAAPPEKKAYTFTTEEGQQYQFRLKANTVRKVANGPLSGARVGIGRAPAALMDWLWRKGEAHGFEPVFEKKENGWDPRWRIESGLLRAWREKNVEEREEMSFAFGLFDGILRVKNPARLLAAVESGIGHAKAFGFGLLSLARISP